MTDIKTQQQQVDKAFDSFGVHFGGSMAYMDPKEYVGLVLIDGLSVQEEKINERIGDLTNITFIGGSAGDDLKFQKTHVFAEGKVYTNAAVLILIKSNTPFDILKTQSFQASEKKAVITKANEPERKIIEINNHPAVDEYSNMVGKPRDKVSDAFFEHPLGIVFEDQIFVRSPQKTEDDKMVFYCSVKEGMELKMLNSTDIVPDTQNALNDKLATFGDISAIVNFHCILRTIDLKQKEQTEQYGNIFKDIPTIGFSTYGESYVGHINQTSTMLLFK